ncbi:MAG TPA: sigma 54-interacting transcriptional regulator [Actinomycetota bacterium]
MWLQWITDAPVEELSGALRAAGLEVDASATSDPAAPGIVFFAESSQRLHEVISDSSRGGMVRVLAVALPGHVLSAGTAWALVQEGASDVIAWDASGDPASDIRARVRRWIQVEELVRSSVVRDHLVGGGRAWTLLLRQIVEVARFTESAVLVSGESGTGKELVARLIHDLDPRPGKGEFVILDCTTVVPTLSGSEFFGHEKGAFTGAVAARDGAFALADGGTLFLDEAGDLPLPLQAELLRVIQEGMYKRVGGNIWRRTKFRLICATNRDLLAEEAAGRFRRDLYYRIAAWSFRLPPLRDRLEDIPMLTRRFLSQVRTDLSDVELDGAVWELLRTREYRGNVRDLRQLVFRIAQRHRGAGPISVGDVPPDERPPVGSTEQSWVDPTFEEAIRRALARGGTLRSISRSAAETAVRIAVAEEQFNLKRAARRLGVTDRALQMRRASRGQPHFTHGKGS